MQASTNIRRTSGRRAGRRKRLLVVLAALMVSVFALLEGGKPTRAIVGGIEVKPADKYPFMVALVYGWGPSTDPRRHFLCGGTLIDKDSVLTAAHCIRQHVDDPNLRRHLAVIAGAKELDVGQGVVRDVTHIWVHDRFNLDPNAQAQVMKYDAAVLTLSQPMPNPKTIHLATSSEDYLEKSGRKVTVTGWGFTKTGGKVSGRLREVQVPITGGLLGDYQLFYKPKFMIAAGEGEGSLHRRQRRAVVP
jgi:trypsin